MGRARKSRRVGDLAWALLATTCLSPFETAAQTTTWTGAANESYAVGANWTAGVPGTSSTAVFTSGAARTSVSGVGDGTQITADAWQFQAGAPAYTFAIGNSGFQFQGAGIVNNASSVPTLNVNGAALYFFNSATAGNATINLTGGVLNFRDTATAGNATIRLTAVSQVNFSNTASGGQARFIVDASSLFDLGTGTSPMTVGSIEGAGSFNLGGRQLTVGGNNLSSTVGGAISGTGSLVKTGSGTLTLSGTNFYTGGTTLNAGGLVVNGVLSSTVTVNGGTLSGSGTIGGGIVANGGILAPGNSIGTLTLNGNFVQNPGSTYQVDVNNAGQSDRITATGTATINGGTVQVLAPSGSYANSTTYTIVSATGGVTGAYSGVTSNFAFLTPSLSYSADNVFLTLALAQNAFSNAGQTPNQKAVGAALDRSFANASGDFAAVIAALAGLTREQGPAALHAIGGQPYADFGTINTSNGALFMNALGQQMAGARGAASGGQRQALAQACDVAACDGASPWGAWAGPLGGLGSVLGDGNASTLTYSFGGGAAGIDYRVDPRILVGIGAGYTHGTQWVNSFLGQGWSDSVSVAAYGSFTQAGFYADALAGYAYSNNQLQRQIIIPNLQPRTANGSTGANQFLGQVETGYGLAVYAPAGATVTPFGRLQVSSVTQNAFTESGAQSLSLNVAQQTTNSLRSTLGADLAGAIGIGDQRTLDLALRLGWMHEYADTGRPITAAFAGAPAAAFTVYGATPQRDSAVVGFSLRTAIADATSLYLRYDGEIGGGTDNHALNIGVRFSW